MWGTLRTKFFFFVLFVVLFNSQSLTNGVSIVRNQVALGVSRLPTWGVGGTLQGPYGIHVKSYATEETCKTR